MNKIFLFISFCILLSSCRKEEGKQASADVYFQGDTLCVSDKSVIKAKIKLETIKTELYSSEFNTTGIIKAIPGQIAEIAPPFDGRVTKSFVKLGQKVNAGAPIFELSSNEFYEATKNYFQAYQTKKMTEINLKRQKDLVANGVGVQKELEETETGYELAQKTYEAALAGLRIFNINPDQLSVGQALKVVSPIQGEVVLNNITIGQYLKSDASPLVIVADLNKVWLVAQVKEKYISKIHPDDSIEIRTDADPDQVLSGHIYHISELLDEETRSVQVLIVCDNENRKLKPGMFAKVHFINSPKESIVIPSSALLQNEAGSYVLARTGENKYIKRFVEVTTGKQNEVIITEGLHPGDVIVSEGGIYLTIN